MSTSTFRRCSVLPIRLLHTSSNDLARNIKPWKIGLENQYKIARSKKVIKIELPDFEELRSNTKINPEEYVSRMKEKGIAPTVPYKEKPIVITSLLGVLDPYVPPEYDAKKSILSTKGIVQKSTNVKQKTQTLMAVKQIRQYQDGFDLPKFVERAQEIYIKTHELLASNAKEELLEYVTEFIYPIMTFQIKNQSIRWKFIKFIEEPRAIQVRTQTMIDKANMFAQITVRFYSQQTLAIYDRFGHLVHGNEALAKDVIEYVVFEKNISEANSKWRLHSKIVPDWLPQKEPIRSTFVRDEPPEPPSEEEMKFFKDGIISDEKKESDKTEDSKLSSVQ
ncbi:signal recognition particle 14 kDa protein-like [Sarcoptes scabiei]|nr:signal recognition particle 14 kDa protein-like [Sarcoptes scabiei]